MRSLMLGKKVNWVWNGSVWNWGSPALTSPLFNPSHLKQCLSREANISQWRSITLVKNCLWWGCSFDTKRRPVIIWDYSFIVERRTCFSEAGFDHGSSGLRCFFTFETWRWWGSEREPRFQTFPLAETARWATETCHIAGTGKPLLFHISHLCVEFGFPIATESIFPITGLLWQQLLSCLETDFRDFLDFEY